MPITGPGIVRSVGDGERIRVDPTAFDGNLTPFDDTVQKALERLDDVVGGGATTLRGSGNPNKVSLPGQFGQSYLDETSTIFYKCVSYPSGTEWTVT